MEIQRILGAIFIASSLISMASAISGTASFYTTYVPSSCFGNSDMGTMIASANPGLFNNKAACGRNCKVRCIGGTNNAVPNACFSRAYITVKIVDQCSGCGPNRIDLSKEAFKMIANPNAGVVRIDYECD